MPRYKVGGQIALPTNSLQVGATQTFQAGLYNDNNTPITPDAGTAQWTGTDGGTVLSLSFSSSTPDQCSVTGVAAGSSTLEYSAAYSGVTYTAQFAITVS